MGVPTEPSHQDIEEAMKNNDLEGRGFQSNNAEFEKESNSGLTGDLAAQCIWLNRSADVASFKIVRCCDSVRNAFLQTSAIRLRI